MNHDVVVEDAQGFVVQLTLHTFDGPDRKVPLGGDSSERVTIPDSVKYCEPVQLGQRLGLTGAWWFFTQSFKFFCY